MPANGGNLAPIALFDAGLAAARDYAFGDMAKGASGSRECALCMESRV